MALNPESGAFHSLEHRVPKFTYSRLETVNSLTTPSDLRLGTAPIAVGEGYAPRYVPLLDRIKELKIQGLTIEIPELGDFKLEVAGIMYMDDIAKSGTAITICTFAHNGHPWGNNLAVTGRVAYENLEINKLIEQDELDDTFCELGRIVAVQDFRGTREDGINQTTELLEELIDAPNGIVEVAQTLGKKKIVTVAKNEFIRHTRSTQLDFGEGEEIILSKDGRRTAEIFRPHWYDPKDPPKRYTAEVPLKAA